MRPLSQTKVFCLLGTLVIVSGLAGFLLGHRLARKQIETRNDPSNWNEHVAQEFDRIVKPSPEQGAKIQASLDSAVRELQQIRLETITRSTNVIWCLIADVEKELTPEQLQAFEQMKPRPADLTLDLLQVKPKDSETNAPVEKH
jgi:hypothetical protein